MIPRSRLNVVLTLGAMLVLGPLGCSSGLVSINSPKRAFIESGSIIISQGVPQRSHLNALAGGETQELMTPLIGFFPPTTAYVPALNEAWLEVDIRESRVRLHVGSEIVEEVKADGTSLSIPGSYFLTQKANRPTWKASDEYFLNRGLSIPQGNEMIRYRKGALGKLALFSSTNKAEQVYASGSPLIHSAPLWTSEVGGIRVPYQALASMFDSLPLGAPIIVK